MLNESCIPPSLLLTKCPGYKMLQSSTSHAKSFITEVVRHAACSSTRAVMHDRSQEIRLES
jgi:hypothetical protein